MGNCSAKRNCFNRRQIASCICLPISSVSSKRASLVSSEKVKPNALELSDDDEINKSDTFVSLEKVKSLSSNAVSVSSRYHCGPNARKLSDDYEIFPKKKLGEGVSGFVVLAKGRHDNRRYALKTIRKTSLAPRGIRQLIREVEIYLSLDHPNVARLRDVYETESQIAFLTECCDGGELYSRLAKVRIYTESDAAKATQQMLRAVGYLHSHSIVHRDLKLQNFLYDNEQEDSLLKLIDFGFAKVWDSSSVMKTPCGSYSYLSPDVLGGKGYTNKCDMWSLGVIVFMLLVGYPPFHGTEKDMNKSILAGSIDYTNNPETKRRWQCVSQDAVDFVKCLLVKDAGDRLGVSGALAHKWMDTCANGTAQDVSKVPLSREAMSSLRKYAKSSRMRRAVLQLLAQELAPEEAKELRDCFLSIDSGNTGTIHLSELKAAIRGGMTSPLQSVSQTCATPTTRALNFGRAKSDGSEAPNLRRANSEVIEELFGVLDANGDEQIYYSDFLAATMDARTQLREQTIRAAFHRLDADNSGSISADDFRNVLGDSFDGVNIERLVEEAANDGSGEVGFDMFVRLVEAVDATTTPKARRRIGLLPADCDDD